MGIPLKNILRLEPLKQGLVVSGRNNLNQLVTGVTIMEAPDIVEWLSGGELILTSLYPIRQQPEKQKELVETLINSGVAGLIIKTHRFIEKTPEQIINTSREYDFPIIEIPEEIRFVDAMYPIMAELFNQQIVKLKFFKDVHNSFTELALKGKGFKAILDSLGDKINNSIMLYDYDHNLIASTDKNVVKYDGKSEDREFINDTLYRVYTEHSALGSLNRKISLVVVPIKVVNHLKAYLLIVEINNKLTELDLISLEQARTVISLEMAKQSAVSEVLQRFKNDIINDLITGRIDSEKYFCERAKLIGWDLEQSFITVIFELDNIDKLYLRGQIKDNLRIKDKIALIISSVIKNSVDNFIIGSRSHSIIVLWPTEDREEHELIKTIKMVSREVQKRVKKKIVKAVVSVGIGSISSSLKQVAEAYQQACQALLFGRKIYGDGVIVALADLGIYRLLCKINEKVALEEYIPESLWQLLEYDHKYNNNLLGTLEEFLKCNLNASQAAKNLFIHYKTMRYRLERIQKIGQIQLDNYEDKLVIEIGLKILYLLNKI